MPSEDYTLRDVNGVYVVRIEADNLLGIVEVNRIGSGLDALNKDAAHNMILDLSRIRYAGSAALGMLLALSKNLQSRGKKLILAGTQHLDTLFKVSRTVAVFEIAPDVDQALGSLQK